MRKAPKRRPCRDGSIDAHNELLYRFELIYDAMLLHLNLGVGLNERKRDKDNFGTHQEERTRHIIAAFIFLQLAAILDSKGTYSLHVNKNSLQTTEENLLNLFPSVSREQIKERTGGINRVLKKYTKLVKTTFTIRDEKIAHAGRKISKFDTNGKHSWFRSVPLVPSSTRFQQMRNFLEELNDELLFPNHSHGV